MPADYPTQYSSEYALHKKYAQSFKLMDLVWTHSMIVADICQQLLDNHLFDASVIDQKELMRACLTHEIGVYLCGGFEWLDQPSISTFPYIQHSIVGAWILFKENYPAEIIQAAYTHKGAGITTQDIQRLKLSLPLEDYIPQTPLTRLVSYASKYHSKAPKWRTAEEIVQSLQRYGKEKAEIFAKWYEFFGPVNIELLEPKYHSWHQAMNNQNTQGSTALSL